MSNVLKEETLYIDFPDISDSIKLQYIVAKNDSECYKFKFYAESTSGMIYDEIKTIGNDVNDYHIVSDTNNQLLIGAIQNTTKYLMDEYLYLST